MRPFVLLHILQSGLIGSSILFASLQAFAEALHDPTRPPEVIVQTLPEGALASNATLTLTGIKADGKGSFAIINNQLVRVGDKFGGYVLVKVSDQYVILKDANHNPLKLNINIENFKKVNSPASKHGNRKQLKKKSVKKL